MIIVFLNKVVEAVKESVSKINILKGLSIIVGYITVFTFTSIWIDWESVNNQILEHGLIFVSSIVGLCMYLYLDHISKKQK